MWMRLVWSASVVVASRQMLEFCKRFGSSGTRDHWSRLLKLRGSNMGSIQFMMMNLAILITANAGPTDSHLELVQILFRHGDRTPNADEIPLGDPYSSIYEKYGYGQLTKVGMQRMYKLGQMLRERYNDILGDYEIGKVYPYSTEVSRAKTSLLLTLAGLFPVTNKTSWNDEIRWFPIPIHYEGLDRSFLTSAHFGECKEKTSKLNEQAEMSLESIRKLSGHDLFIKILKEKSGLSSLHSIHSYIRAIKNMGLELPKWCPDQDLEKLHYVASVIDQSHYISTDWSKKMNGGLILEKFSQNIYNSSSKKTKMYLYSAHEFQLISVSEVLQFFKEPSIPDYGSAIILEKYRKGDTGFLRMFMWKGATEHMVPVKLIDCDYDCPLEIYLAKIKQFFPSKEDRNC